MYQTHSMARMDNEAGLEWLESALEHAFTRGQMVLVAYLEELMDEVLFEMELDAPSQLPARASSGPKSFAEGVG